MIWISGRHRWLADHGVLLFWLVLLAAALHEHTDDEDGMNGDDAEDGHADILLGLA